ncbi:hypothetical protein T06_11693 [Trichinella sp. T6]|nr:hypothetical protein T06_6284 [Trichinella sp. T6]KRX73112.1 hypothetical protein T06_2424 [Trichinella sp. T6]KRX74666.1 hypothetical protein T06_11693 [Trichinella sp. T6]
MKADRKVQLGLTDDTNGEERRGERCRLTLKRPHIRRDIQRCKKSWRIVDVLKRTVRCPLTIARWEISPCKSFGLQRARGNRRARKRLSDKNTQLCHSGDT